ncbi:MAG TPA: nitroreductase family deazaflavin-dependent oxidoreductase [Oceanobacillus sp.]|nr:nitroreductase family deazaflavin-dependent oxidoreductase [Oceanobacillus sp.]
MSTLNGQLIPYPQGLGRWLMRLPLLLYRVGLGDLANAAHIMVLTTQGRKSGLPRHTPIEYRQHGSKIYLISAWGTRPQWYQNILSNAAVTVQQGRKQFSASAHIVTNSGEALRVLHLFRRRAPAIYDALLARISEREDIDPRTLPEITDRITIVRLMPEPGTSKLAPLPANLVWIWPASLIVGITLTLMLTLARSKRTSHD